MKVARPKLEKKMTSGQGGVGKCPVAPRGFRGDLSCDEAAIDPPYVTGQGRTTNASDWENLPGGRELGRSHKTLSV